MEVKNMQSKAIIFHIDVNSAFLSWTAIDELRKGNPIDLRTIPAIIGGDPKLRHGIVLAKSEAAKKYKIVTGEPIAQAMKKCPNLTIVPPSHGLYGKCSESMFMLLSEYSPIIQQFSIDEGFLDFSGMENIYGDYLKTAYNIKDRIKNELGFTVNVGISCNKLLAKMASDLEKPDKVHTLFPEEVPQKMWPLPVGDLFGVGRRTVPALNQMGIKTIGDLAKANPNLLESRFKSQGLYMHKSANGIDDSTLTGENHEDVKSIGNSTTTSMDIIDAPSAYKVIIKLTESVASRLRAEDCVCSTITVQLRNSLFKTYSRQKTLAVSTDKTDEIIHAAKKIFSEAWKGEPLRLIGVSVSGLTKNEEKQLNLFDIVDNKKNEKLDKVIDMVRGRFGKDALERATFVKKKDHL